MSERDVMEYDVAVIGAGPAGLAYAIRLKQINPERMICVLEKGSEVGAHALSGAVLEPGSLDELLPEWRQNPPAICVPAKDDTFLKLSKTGAMKLPTPPQQNNHGNFIISQGQLVKWMAEQAEALEVDVFPGFAGAEALFGESNEVIGVRVGDMGLESDGTPGPAYTAGVDIHAKLTVLAEGCRGSITKQLIKRYELDAGKSPQTYGLGFKELWQLPPGRVQPGNIQHTVGWPLDNKTYGGTFLYHLENDQVYIGFVVGLDYQDPNLAPFEAFQQFKHHPRIKGLLEGGEVIATGARTLVEGGYQSMPKLEMPGAMLIGDTAGTLNVPKIKGIHVAISCAMLAAEHTAESLSAEGFDEAFRASPSGRELHKVRNIRPGFKWGLWGGMVNAGLETVFMGKLPWTLKHHADWSSMKKLGGYNEPKKDYVDRDLAPRDRLASVYFAGNAHEESQPVHLKVADLDLCSTRCTEEYGNPCIRFCPAGVYEMVDNDAGGKKLQINASNCVHCKACDIKDPYEQITWVTPEGGSGPNYGSM